MEPAKLAQGPTGRWQNSSLLIIYSCTHLPIWPLSRLWLWAVLNYSLFLQFPRLMLACSSQALVWPAFCIPGFSIHEFNQLQIKNIQGKEIVSVFNVYGILPLFP
jgi:hypothetical protein